MRRHFAAVVMLVLLSWSADSWLGSALSAAAPGSVETGRVSGLISDGVGRGVADASVLALGQTIITARSDMRGHFSLTLPPGDYVLRASRSGYISTYREPLRVKSSMVIERNITMTRQDDGPSTFIVDDTHSHTDLAWILRHMPRSVLRDGAAALPGDSTGEATGVRAGNFAQGSTRVAALAGSDWRGQVNFMTTAATGNTSLLSPAGWPRGIAFVTLGAPVVGYGAWQLRAAVASGDASSWNVLGAYDSDPDHSHIWKVRLSYSAQGYTTATEQLTAAVGVFRSAAGVSVGDRWQVTPDLMIEYGIRAERFDYLADPQLFSGNAGFRMRVMPRTFVVVRGGQNMVAPGADEFLPPPAAGPWLPAERMFSPLSERGGLQSETVRYGEVLLRHHFSDSDVWPTVEVRSFRQQVTNQMATLFGLEPEDGRGQYFVAPVGAVDLEGWAAGTSGRIGRYFTGRVEYSRAMADWQSGHRIRSVRRVAPSVLRSPIERLDDLTATIAAEIPATATHLSLIYRASTAYSPDDGAQTAMPGQRFDLQVRQALPYQPTRGSRLELVFGVRNLFRDARGESSWYDELLTVGPPLRLMGGIQVRF